MSIDKLKTYINELNLIIDNYSSDEILTDTDTPTETSLTSGHIISEIAKYSMPAVLLSGIVTIVVGGIFLDAAILLIGTAVAGSCLGLLQIYQFKILYFDLAEQTIALNKTKNSVAKIVQQAKQLKNDIKIKNNEIKDFRKPQINTKKKNDKNNIDLSLDFSPIQEYNTPKKNNEEKSFTSDYVLNFQNNNNDLTLPPKVDSIILINESKTDNKNDDVLE